MKRISWIFTALAALAFTGLAQAQVPSLINYQGRLTDKAGTPVNGPVNIGIKIFDAATDGKAYYTEDIGEVTVVNGVYSFNYGAGQSLAEATETVSFADGVEKVYNYNTQNKPIIGEVTVNFKELKWNSSGGNDQAEMIGSIDKETGRVSVIFLNSVPEAAKEIKIKYNYYSDGISPVFTSGKSLFLEVSVNGKGLSPRQAIVFVPQAIWAKTSKYAENLVAKERDKVLYDKSFITGSVLTRHYHPWGRISSAASSGQGGLNPSRTSISLDDIPDDISVVVSIQFKASMVGYIPSGNARNYGNYYQGVGFRLLQTEWSGGESTKIFEYLIDNEQSGLSAATPWEVEKTIPVNVELDHEKYRYNLSVFGTSRSTNVTYANPSSSSMNHFRLNCRSKLPF
jgi:hypothetical protein